MADDQNLNQSSVVNDQSSDENTTDPTQQDEIAQPQAEEVVDVQDVIPSANEESTTLSDNNNTNLEGSSEPEVLQNDKDEKLDDRDSKLDQEDGSTILEEKTADQTSNIQSPEPASNVEDPISNDNPNARWYVVHTYSGHENKVATTLKQKVETERLEEKILDVLVPVQDKIEIKNGKKATIKEKIFPGYILVKMVLDDDSWVAVRTTQGVTSFVGIGNKPTPISEKEVQTIIAFTKNTEPIYKQVFMANDTVKIVEGPFAEFIGKVDSVDEERGKVKVLVSIFGRETPVELDFLQVQKI